MNSRRLTRYHPTKYDRELQARELQAQLVDCSNEPDFTSNLTSIQIKQILIDAANVFKFCIPQFMTAQDYYNNYLPASKWFQRNNQHKIHEPIDLDFALKHTKYHYNTIHVTSNEYQKKSTIQSLIDLKCKELIVLYSRNESINFTNLPEQIKVLKLDFVYYAYSPVPILPNTLPHTLISLHITNKYPSHLSFDNTIELFIHPRSRHGLPSIQCPNLKSIIIKEEIAWDELYHFKDVILYVESVGPNHRERISKQKKLYTMAYLKLKLELKELHVQKWDQNWLPRQLIPKDVPFYVQGRLQEVVLPKVNVKRKRKTFQN